MTRLEWLEGKLKYDSKVLEYILSRCLRMDKYRCDKCEFVHDDFHCDGYISGAEELAKWLFKELTEEEELEELEE